jgi:CRP-like cAMP-binding protein
VIGDALLTYLSCIGPVCAEDAEAIRMVKGEVRTIRRHKDVLSSGDSPRFGVVVLKGFLCRYTTSARGTRQIHNFYMPTDVASLEALHLDYLDDTLGTLVASVVGLVPYANLFRLMEERPGVAALIRRGGALQGSIYRQWLARNSTQSAHASMAHLFCEIYVRADAAGLAGNGRCALPVTQENLGEALGLTAVHVNRTLQLLRQIGLIELKLGQLFINDLDELAKLGEFDPHYLHLKRGAGSVAPPRRHQGLSRMPPGESVVGYGDARTSAGAA